MITGKKILVVMPAFNAGKTLVKTINSIPRDIIDDILLVDDASNDDTVQLARNLGIKVLRHETNMGYGANQKSCYTAALKTDADVIVMLHPDYQYEPKLLCALASMVCSGVYDVALGSRILSSVSAREQGMPWWKYYANRVLTLFQNILLDCKLSEYHTGYRAYSATFLKHIKFINNSDDFIFDNQLLVQAILNKYLIGEMSVPTKYFEEASSINFSRSCKYGIGVLVTSLRGFLHRIGIYVNKDYIKKT